MAEKKVFLFSFFGYCAEFVDVKNGEKRLLATGQAEMILSDKVDLLHVEKVHLAQERCNRKGTRIFSILRYPCISTSIP